MAPLPRGSKIAAFAYSRLSVPPANQPFLMLAALFGIQLILFGTAGAISPPYGSWPAGYDPLNLFWSVAVVFAVAMLYSMFVSKNRRNAFLSASIAVAFVAVQHLYYGLMYLNAATYNANREVPESVLLYWNILNVNYVCSVLASIPLILMAIFLAKDRAFEKKLCYLIISYGLLQMPYNVALFVYVVSSTHEALPLFSSLSNLFYISTCSFMILAAINLLKTKQNMELGNSILRPLGATLLSYGGAQLVSFITLLITLPNAWNRPIYNYFLFNASYQAVLAVTSLLLIGLATYFVRTKSLKLGSLAIQFGE